MDNGRSDTRFPGSHYIDWSRSTTQPRRDSTYDPRTAGTSRCRESQALRYVDEDTGYSARSHQPMTTIYAVHRDRRYRSARDSHDSYSRYGEATQRERTGYEDRNRQHGLGDRERNGLPSYHRSSRQDDARSFDNSFRGESTTRLTDRRDMFPSMNEPSSSRHASTRQRSDERSRDHDYATSRTDSRHRSSTHRNEGPGAGWPRFHNSCEGRWPFSPDDF